jgi:hypothetical protein
MGVSPDPLIIPMSSGVAGLSRVCAAINPCSRCSMKVARVMLVIEVECDRYIHVVLESPTMLDVDEQGFVLGAHACSARDAVMPRGEHRSDVYISE